MKNIRYDKNSFTSIHLGGESLEVRLGDVTVKVSLTNQSVNEGSYIVLRGELGIVSEIHPLKAVLLRDRREHLIEKDSFERVHLLSMHYEGEWYRVSEEAEILPYDLVMDPYLEIFDSPPVSIDSNLMCEYLVSRQTKKPKYIGNFERLFTLTPFNPNKKHRAGILQILEDLEHVIRFLEEDELNAPQIRRLEQVQREANALREEIFSV